MPLEPLLLRHLVLESRQRPQQKGALVSELQALLGQPIKQLVILFTKSLMNRFEQ